MTEADIEICGSEQNFGVGNPVLDKPGLVSHGSP